MFLRLLLLLLLAMNLGVGGWLLFGRHAPAYPPPTDPGVAELQLLSPNASAAAPAPASARFIKASGQCLRIGPFTTQASMRNAFNALSPRVAQIQFQKQDVTRDTGWWVYLPAFATQEEALSVARKLADEGIKDYYVVTAGDNQNTVSLGLFHNPDNARHRLAKIEKLGIHPKLTQRQEILPEYWLEIALPQTIGFDWHAHVGPASVTAQPVACF